MIMSWPIMYVNVFSTQRIEIMTVDEAFFPTNDYDCRLICANIVLYSVRLHKDIGEIGARLKIIHHKLWDVPNF